MSQPPANPYPPQQPGSGSPYGSYPQQQPGAYQQPGTYPQQPGQPYGAPAVPLGPPPKKKSSVGKILLIVLAVVLVLCVGGVGVSYFLVKDEVEDVVEATKTTVVLPETLAGRPKATDKQLQAAADEMTATMKKDVPGATGTVGGFYGDLEKQDLVMVAAAAGLLANPKKELDDAVNAFSTQLSVTNMAPVEPGPLGGEAKCGDGKTEGIEVGICAWADRGSLGMIVIYFKSAKDLEKEFVTMRGEIEKRS